MPKEKDKATFYFPAEEWVLPAASTKEPEEREFVVDSEASMHMFSKRDLNSAELEHEDIEKSDDGDDGQRRSAIKRRSNGLCQGIGFIRVMLLEDIPAVLSLGKLCEDHGKTCHWTSGQKNTCHQKRQEN